MKSPPKRFCRCTCARYLSISSTAVDFTQRTMPPTSGWKTENSSIIVATRTRKLKLWCTRREQHDSRLGNFSLLRWEIIEFERRIMKIVCAYFRSPQWIHWGGWRLSLSKIFSSIEIFKDSSTCCERFSRKSVGERDSSQCNDCETHLYWSGRVSLPLDDMPLLGRCRNGIFFEFFKNGFRELKTFTTASEWIPFHPHAPLNANFTKTSEAPPSIECLHTSGTQLLKPQPSARSEKYIETWFKCKTEVCWMLLRLKWNIC